MPLSLGLRSPRRFMFYGLLKIKILYPENGLHEGRQYSHTTEEILPFAWNVCSLCDGAKETFDLT
jgi:hypothetical protein